IHYLLARTHVTPPSVIVPVSAVMLARRAEYDQVLERFSTAVMPLVDYELEADGSLLVTNETADHYRYFDATPMAEALHRWLDEALHTELRGELDFLVRYQDTKAAMANIIDMPDHLVDLFIKIVTSNGGSLSKRKREEFVMLSDDEVSALEGVVRRHMLGTNAAAPQ
ncbi:MAG TPA: cell filamentation protein Fic, partial [Kofleriaceae bacterium]|nr:cell filamentation protein Fic [Kofleriaceae bacterium]